MASGALPVGTRDVAAGLDDPVKGRAVDNEVPDDGKRSCPPRLDDDRVAVGELAHVELARCRALLRPVRLTVDHDAAGAADALTAVVVERDRLFALDREVLVHLVEHLEERCLGEMPFAW